MVYWAIGSFVLATLSFVMGVIMGAMSERVRNDPPPLRVVRDEDVA